MVLSRIPAPTAPTTAVEAMHAPEHFPEAPITTYLTDGIEMGQWNNPLILSNAKKELAALEKRAENLTSAPQGADGQAGRDREFAEQVMPLYETARQAWAALAETKAEEQMPWQKNAQAMLEQLLRLIERLKRMYEEPAEKDPEVAEIPPGPRTELLKAAAIEGPHPKCPPLKQAL